MKDFLKIFVGTVAVVLGLKAGSALGDLAGKGIDKGCDALSNLASCKKEAETPAAE